MGARRRSLGGPWLGLSHRTPGCPRSIHLSPTSTDVGLTNGQTEVLHASRAEARQSTRAMLTFRQFVTDSKERAPKEATPYPVPRQGQHPNKRGQLPAPQNHSISAHCELTPDSRHTPQGTGRKPHIAELETGESLLTASQADGETAGRMWSLSWMPVCPLVPEDHSYVTGSA